MTQIKKVKKEIYDELFPRDTEVAFRLANCKIHDAQDSYEDNLYRFYGRFLLEAKKKKSMKMTLSSIIIIFLQLD